MVVFLPVQQRSSSSLLLLQGVHDFCSVNHDPEDGLLAKDFHLGFDCLSEGCLGLSELASGVVLILGFIRLEKCPRRDSSKKLALMTSVEKLLPLEGEN